MEHWHIKQALFLHLEVDLAFLIDLVHLLLKLFAFQSHYRQFTLEFFLKALSECNVGFRHGVNVLVNSFFRVSDFYLGGHEGSFLVV